MQKPPFFQRLWLASVYHLVVAALLTAIALLDVLVAPFGEWVAGEPAPTTYRAGPQKHSPSDELLPLPDIDAPAADTSRFLVVRGQPVTLSVLEELERLLPERRQLEPKRVAGMWAFYFLALTFFNQVLRRSRRHLFMRFRAVATLTFVLLLVALATRLLFDLTTLSPYTTPVYLAVLLFAPLLTQTIALAVHLLAVALVAPMIAFSPGMILVPLLAGWSAGMLLRTRSGTGRMLVAAVAAAGVGVLAMLGLDLFSPHGFDYRLHWQADLVGLALSALACGVVSVVFAYPVTRLSGGVPRSKLEKLRDLDHPVLKDLAEKAPGTFQHTLAVANMAEKVADDIGADDALVRTGAYYHDIGKMGGPEYFVENQRGDNPHDRLTPDASAQKLRSHVTQGLTIARGADLPERIQDFILEHHGASVMEYFMDKAARAEGKKPDPARFTYPGRNPTSRETAVLMIVDSVEAASRTLKDPDRDKIEDLVRQILFGKLLNGALDDSGLTSRDLKRIGQSLIRYLAAQLHVRIEYPWQKRDSDRPLAEANHSIRPVTNPAMRVVLPMVEDGTSLPLPVPAVPTPLPVPTVPTPPPASSTPPAFPAAEPPGPKDPDPHG